MKDGVGMIRMLPQTSLVRHGISREEKESPAHDCCIDGPYAQVCHDNCMLDHIVVTLHSKKRIEHEDHIYGECHHVNISVNLMR